MTSSQLADDSKNALLRLARTAMSVWLERREIIDPGPLTSELSERRGAFVTIQRGDRLRGCIGSTEPDGPLAEVVRDMSIAAATRDPRFPALTADELDDCDIEISVLSPAEPIAGPDDIIVGQHGLMISAGFRRGLLLPQVASERGWDAAFFLTMVCRKAGLVDGAWRENGVALHRFEAEVFGERPGH